MESSGGCGEAPARCVSVAVVQSSLGGPRPGGLLRLIWGVVVLQQHYARGVLLGDGPFGAVLVCFSFGF